MASTARVRCASPAGGKKRWVANCPKAISPVAPIGLAVATNALITCGGTAVGTIVAHVQSTGDERAAAVAWNIHVNRLKYQGVCDSPAPQASLYERGLASRHSRELGLLVVWDRKLTDVTTDLRVT
jgi:hypothetical protein